MLPLSKGICHIVHSLSSQGIEETSLCKKKECHQVGREYVNFVNGFSPSSRKIICNIKSKLAFINSEGICYIVNSLSPGESDFSGNSFFFCHQKNEASDTL